MSTDQLINMLIMPVGGLIIGLIALFLTKDESRQHKDRRQHPGE